MNKYTIYFIDGTEVDFLTNGLGYTAFDMNTREVVWQCSDTIIPFRLIKAIVRHGT